MKIEIELSEVEYLKSELNARELEVIELESKLTKLSEAELRKKAVALSWRLFNEYLATMFKHLGFDVDNNERILTPYNLEQALGKHWWNSERIHFDLSATVEKNFRTAFLRIGIIPKEKLPKEIDYEL